MATVWRIPEVGPPPVKWGTDRSLGPHVPPVLVWRPPVPTAYGTTNEALLVWQARMPTEAFPVDVGAVGFQVVDDENTETEISRKTKDVRVENPDDPNQFIEVEVIEELQLQNAQGTIRTIKLDND